MQASVKILKAQLDEKDKEAPVSQEYAQAADLRALKEEINEHIIAQIETLESKLESLDKTQHRQPATTMISSTVNSQSQWQESSVKKFEQKKTGGWAELRMTKIEPRESSMRSSNLEMQMVCASGPSSVLKSVPPQDIDESVENAAQDEIPFGKFASSDAHKSVELQTPEKTTSIKKSPSQLEIEGQLSRQSQQ